MVVLLGEEWTLPQAMSAASAKGVKDQIVVMGKKVPTAMFLRQ